MALITLKILVIIYLTMSIMTDFSAYATCTETDNCGSDSGAEGGDVFPDITTGQANFNTAHGYHAMGTEITTGDANTIVGYEAGRLINTGSYNTAVGYFSYNITSL